MMRIVSACLAGVPSRYNGQRLSDPRIEAMVAAGEALPVCPEQLGGLPTPRAAASVLDRDRHRVIDENGNDVTAFYTRGAEETARLARLVGAREAILKENSPSCGSCRIWVTDGDGHLEAVSGEGITTALLRRMGVTVYSEETWPGSEQE